MIRTFITDDVHMGICILYIYEILLYFDLWSLSYVDHVWVDLTVLFLFKLVFLF